MRDAPRQIKSQANREKEADAENRASTPLK